MIKTGKDHLEQLRDGRVVLLEMKKFLMLLNIHH